MLEVHQDHFLSNLGVGQANSARESGVPGGLHPKGARLLQNIVGCMNEMLELLWFESFDLECHDPTIGGIWPELYPQLAAKIMFPLCLLRFGCVRL
jgi:hypothetical protein